MKVTLEFNLPEEQTEFDAANAALALRGAIMSADETLRSAIIHGPPPDMPATPVAALEWARKILREALEDNNVAHLID